MNKNIIEKYLKDNKDQYPKESLIQKLKQSGCSDYDIDQAEQVVYQDNSQLRLKSNKIKSFIKKHLKLFIFILIIIFFVIFVLFYNNHVENIIPKFYGIYKSALYNKEKVSCLNQKGEWRRSKQISSSAIGINDYENYVCVKEYSDGGKTCKSSDECEGDCVFISCAVGCKGGGSCPGFWGIEQYNCILGKDKSVCEKNNDMKCPLVVEAKEWYCGI